MFSLNEDFLGQVFKENKIKDFKRVSGGDINQAYALVDQEGKRYFLKVQPDSVPAFFQHEANGLRLLSRAARVPGVLDLGQVGNDQWLLLEHMRSTNYGDQFALGKTLAAVHQLRSPNGQFGLDYDFKAGKTPKINHWRDNWTDFFIEQRLNVLRQLLIDEGKWQDDDAYNRAVEKFRRLMKFHKSVPSLLHGDFWAGNFMFEAKTGAPVLIDPDVYYGDSEFDIGVTTVFGGFHQEFYDGYQSVRPFDQGIDDRLNFYQLYYLMVHAHLFAGSYIYAYRRELNDINSL